MKMSDSLPRKAAALTGLVLGSVLLLTGCEQEGPAERAGKAIDDSTEQAGEYMEEQRDEASQNLQDSPDRQYIEGADDSFRD